MISGRVPKMVTTFIEAVPHPLVDYHPTSSDIAATYQQPRKVP
jgi:hypothetical protein